MINPFKSHHDRMRNDRVISVNMLFCLKSVDQKGCDNFIMTSWVHLYHSLINPFKSHHDRMKNDQVISVNMLFLSVISEPKTPCIVIIMCGVHLY